jgi:hypothetical protein
MNAEQFLKLAEAYGADVKRWPDFHQKQYSELMALNFPEVNQAIDEARLLDEMFASHSIAPTERKLIESIISSAPQIKKSFWQQLNTKAWLGFSGLIGTGLAGALAGAFFASIWTSGPLSANMDSTGESVGSMAQYVDVGQEWS